jgi:hypothetical protein
VKTIANIKVSYVDSFITYEKSGLCTAVNKGCIRLRLRTGVPWISEPSRRFNLLFTVEGSGIQGSTGATHVETDELNRVQLVHFRAFVAAVRKRKG